MWKNERLWPSQPYFVMNTENFCQEIYLDQGISHFYTFDPVKGKKLYAVPDGCIDLVFQYHNDDRVEGYAFGTVLGYQKSFFSEEGEVFGVRFMPGYFPAGLSATQKQLVGKGYLLSECFSKDFSMKQMMCEKDFHKRIKIFMNEYTRLEQKKEKPYGKKALVYSINDMVYKADGVIKVSEISDRTGYSERYISRVFSEEMGFPPKTFCKIIQFQRALEFMNYGAPEKMTDAVMQLGYYDQAQFIKDFKKYAGITPYKYHKLIEAGKYREKITSVHE